MEKITFRDACGSGVIVHSSERTGLENQPYECSPFTFLDLKTWFCCHKHVWISVKLSSSVVGHLALITAIRRNDLTKMMLCPSFYLL